MEHDSLNVGLKTAHDGEAQQIGSAGHQSSRDQDRRFACLVQAVQLACSSPANAMNITKTAQEMYDFVTAKAER